MRVIIFGAGASAKAGYPLSSQLVSQIGAFCEGEPNRLPGPKLSWRAAQQSISQHLEKFGIIRESQSIELLLSMLDLFVVAGNDRMNEYHMRIKPLLKRFRAKKPTDPTHWQDARKPHDDAIRETMWAANGREQLLYCLDKFLRYKHRQDSLDDNGSRRMYLSDLLTDLDDRDVVVTLNWDALTERVLAAQGKWTPVDGYGFKKTSLRYKDKRLKGPCTSKVRVLKLHGSVGWYWDDVPFFRKKKPTIFFDGRRFLKDLGYPCDNEPFSPDEDIEDDHPAFDLATEHPVIVHPSFLKSFWGYEFSEIWHQARVAINQATRIEIYGYSIPIGDGAFRIVLNDIAVRLRRKQVSVEVWDPDASARARWKQLLGPNAKVRNRRLE